MLNQRLTTATLAAFLTIIPASSATLESLVSQTQPTISAKPPLDFSKTYSMVKELVDNRNKNQKKVLDIVESLAGWYGFEFDRNKFKGNTKNSLRLDYLGNSTIIVDYEIEEESGKKIVTYYIHRETYEKIR